MGKKRPESAIALHHGDCREVLAGLPADSVEACVTDPPYELRFMSKSWDATGIANSVEMWAAVLRVLKPGAHLAAFGGTRTHHRMMCAIEDAGFEIRDTLMWVYGSGFPKSHNQPGGLGTALKPAWEPIVLARKPLQGTVAANVARYGTGALNIDGCRVGMDTADRDELAAKASKAPLPHGSPIYGDYALGIATPPHSAGRWPANVCHDGSPEVLAAFAAFGERSGRPGQKLLTVGSGSGEKIQSNAYGAGGLSFATSGHADTGTAARFFYAAKASRKERGEGNCHPTVKPLALMQWLCRLVTPHEGTVLDPFAGSGSTLIAADCEGLDAIGIELSAEYVEIAHRRIHSRDDEEAEAA